MYKKWNTKHTDISYINGKDIVGYEERKGRIILKGGRIIDPKNKVDAIQDIAIYGNEIVELEDVIIPEKGDKVINCDKLMVWPGLIDMHLHIGDLFDISTESVFCAAKDGVTVGLSPGAGNTFMAPALLGAEVDRGLPINTGVYLGGANVLGTMLSTEELIKLFKGELPDEIACAKMTRNNITNRTAPFVVGIKDHMGHFLMSDENIERIFQITDKANLVYMSHTQDPEHTLRLLKLSKGRRLHLGHANAAGCGSHMDPVEGMKLVVDICNNANISGEFVTTMLRKGLGSREGMQMTNKSRQVALDAIEAGIVDILVSDGQNQATMKGFGDTRDNIPCILELASEGILPLSELIAMMTVNPAVLIGKITGNKEWLYKLGHLGIGAIANFTIVDPLDKLATYVIVNGKIVAFENRLIRKNSGAGFWVSKFGIMPTLGIGQVSMYE